MKQLLQHHHSRYDCWCVGGIHEARALTRGQATHKAKQEEDVEVKDLLALSAIGKDQLL